jgi:acyl dehydratase
MTERFRFADVPRRTGSTFTSPWITVDRRRMELFDESTFYDPAEYGWDVDSFPDDMVEGFHLLSLVPYLVNLAARLDDPSAFTLNYGLDRVRFVTPVFAGERLRAHAVVAEVRPKRDGYLVLNQITVEVEGRERPGFTADLWALVLPRVPENLSTT